MFNWVLNISETAVQDILIPFTLLVSPPNFINLRTNLESRLECSKIKVNCKIHSSKILKINSLIHLLDDQPK